VARYCAAQAGVSIGQAQAEAEPSLKKFATKNTIARTAGQYFHFAISSTLSTKFDPRFSRSWVGHFPALMPVECGESDVGEIACANENSPCGPLGRWLGGVGSADIRRGNLIAALGTALGVGLAYLGIHQLLVIAPEICPP